MAISRHDPEWLRVIAMAALAGVTFQHGYTRYQGKHKIIWYASLPSPVERGAKYVVDGGSKYQVAKLMLEKLGIENVATHD